MPQSSNGCRVRQGSFPWCLPFGDINQWCSMGQLEYSLSPYLPPAPLQAPWLSQRCRHSAWAAWEKLAIASSQQAGFLPVILHYSEHCVSCCSAGLFWRRFCLCQGRHKCSVRGKTLIAFAQQPSSKHFLMFLHVFVEILICVFQSVAVSFWKGKREGKKSGSHVIR